MYCRSRHDPRRTGWSRPITGRLSGAYRRAAHAVRVRRARECGTRLIRARTTSTASGRIERPFPSHATTGPAAAQLGRAQEIGRESAGTRPQGVHTRSAAGTRRKGRSPQYRPYPQHVVVAGRRIPQYVVFLGLDCTGATGVHSLGWPGTERARNGRREPRDGGRERLATVQLEEERPTPRSYRRQSRLPGGLPALPHCQGRNRVKQGQQPRARAANSVAPRSHATTQHQRPTTTPGTRSTK
jgi:hypothetical protein